jgi:5-carboxyvanillate decarboxylase
VIAGERVVAVEEHFATPEYVEAVLELPSVAGDEVEMALMRGVLSGGPVHDALLDLDSRLAEMEEHGVDQAVLSLNPPGVQPFDPEPAIALASRSNDALAEIVRPRPDRFAGLGAIAPQAVAWSAAEIERIMGPLGLHGVMVCSHTGGRYLDEPEFEPILEALAAHEAPLYLHPRYPSPQMLGPYADYGMAAALWGYQAEAGTHAVRLILSGAFDRHPGLQVVLGHLGEGLPFWMTRLDNRYEWTYRAVGEAAGMVGLELTPSEYLKRNFALSTSGMGDPEALAFCLDRVGEDRLMFAVDHPYEGIGSAAAFLRDADLSPAQREKISHSNAEALFGLQEAWPPI